MAQWLYLAAAILALAAGWWLIQRWVERRARTGPTDEREVQRRSQAAELRKRRGWDPTDIDRHDGGGSGVGG